VCFWFWFPVVMTRVMTTGFLIMNELGKVRKTYRYFIIRLEIHEKAGYTRHSAIRRNNL
jgi:hypothetical protein